jgi:uncharacterized lipoprotein YbaY
VAVGQQALGLGVGEEHGSMNGVNRACRPWSGIARDDVRTTGGGARVQLPITFSPSDLQPGETLAALAKGIVEA